jgi:hypothetical protein
MKAVLIALQIQQVPCLPPMLQRGADATASPSLLACTSQRQLNVDSVNYLHAPYFFERRGRAHRI